jgi:tRNA (cmo5U34)-methyltransferase
MGQFHFDPATYRDVMRGEVPDYDDFEDAVAAATFGVSTSHVLDLGAGTGETARRILDLHDQAILIGIDDSHDMLAGAEGALPAERVDLRVGRLEDPLPSGPFDLVVSALAVHHLDARHKQDLFVRVHQALRMGGRFVLGDVVVPRPPSDAVIPLDPEYDHPDSVSDQLEWLQRAGFTTTVAWQRRDLAVIVGDRLAATR